MGAILDVIRPCIAWIPILWGENYFDLFAKRKIDCDYEPGLPLVDECVDNIVQSYDGPIPELPFDIMINILSRLPAKCIYQLWQIKSKPLYALTTPPLFMRTHLNRATPTIVVQSFTQSSNNDIKLFLFDEESDSVEPTGLKLDLCDAYCKEPIVLCGSCDGFLLFKTQNSRMPVFCIWNPVTKEQVIVTSPRHLMYVCGFYFHPNKEYEVVYVCTFGSQSHFQVLNLRNNHIRSVGSCSYPPDYQRPPVFIDGTLYWMVDIFMYFTKNDVYPSFSHSILTFNTETEEFSTMETVMPSGGNVSRYHREQFHLFEMEGDLCLFDNSSFNEVFIWVLNCITKCWVKMHSMAVPIDGRRWDFYWHFKEVVYVKKKGEFLVKHWNKRLVNCNLRLDSWKFVEKKGFEGDDFTAVIHTPSLLSLHASDSVICMTCDEC